MSISFGLGSGRRDGGPGILQSRGGMQFQQRHLLYTMNADGLQRRSSLPWVSAFRDFNLYEENSSLCSEEEERHVEKKRRLSVQQVRSLEKSFEVESKLEPERKMQLATELGLQPRQVAVWFQNRRARWKTKQLERDYEHLKQHYNVVLSEKEKLRAEVARLTRELQHAGKQEEEDREPDQHTSISSDCCCSQGTAILITPQNNTEGEQEEDETQIVGADKAEEEELEQAMSPPSFCSDADSNWGQQLLITSSCNNIDIVQSVKNQENREKLETLLYLNSYQQQMGCDLYYNDCPITAEEHQWLSFCSHTKP